MAKLRRKWKSITPKITHTKMHPVPKQITLATRQNLVEKVKSITPKITNTKMYPIPKQSPNTVIFCSDSRNVTILQLKAPLTLKGMLASSILLKFLLYSNISYTALASFYKSFNTIISLQFI